MERPAGRAGETFFGFLQGSAGRWRRIRLGLDSVFMNSTSASSASMSTAPRPLQDKRTQRPKLYNVILLDDNDHTYDYVIGMLEKLFGYTIEQAYQLACDVDTTGRVVVETAPLERAEFKRDQIHAFGRDWRIPRCCGSMSSLIEPADG